MIDAASRLERSDSTGSSRHLVSCVVPRSDLGQTSPDFRRQAWGGYLNGCERRNSNVGGALLGSNAEERHHGRRVSLLEGSLEEPDTLSTVLSSYTTAESTETSKATDMRPSKDRRSRSKMSSMSVNGFTVEMPVHEKRIDVVKAALAIAHHKDGPQMKLVRALEDLFNAYDGNEDAVVDVDEFVEGQKALHENKGKPLDIKKVVGLYFHVDSTECGAMKLDDFKKWQIANFTSMKKGIEEMIEICNTNAELIRQHIGRTKLCKVALSRRRSSSEGRLKCERPTNRESVIIQLGRKPLKTHNPRSASESRFRPDIHRTLCASDTFVDNLNTVMRQDAPRHESSMRKRPVVCDLTTPGC